MGSIDWKWLIIGYLLGGFTFAMLRSALGGLKSKVSGG